MQLYIRLSNDPLLAREGVRLEPVAVAASCHKTNLRLEICVWNYKSIPGEDFHLPSLPEAAHIHRSEYAR